MIVDKWMDLDTVINIVDISKYYTYLCYVSKLYLNIKYNSLHLKYLIHISSTDTKECPVVLTPTRTGKPVTLITLRDPY